MAIDEELSALSLGKETTQVPVCATCQSPANLACKGCLLVTYCGTECQKAHWAIHKSDCRCPLSKDDWQLSWVVQNRSPAFTGNSDGLVAFGGKKYFWGNVPAYDVVKLERNEAAMYQGKLQLLFAASGDVRNIITSISSLPSTYKRSIHVTSNDLDFDVVARNIIILLIALIVEDDGTAVDCMLHIWYSAALRQAHLDILTLRIRPFIEDVTQKVASKPAGSLLGKTWTLGSHTIRVELTKQQWDALLLFFDIPPGLTPALAKQARDAVVSAPSRLDYRERHMVMLQPSHRLCFAKFREDGILLPFGKSRDRYSVPNPTFCQSTSWPMKDDAEPTAGWDLEDIINTSAGPAKNDFYGKLFVLISQKLYAFRQKLATQVFDFRLTNVNAIELSDASGGNSYARIEVSNISDGGYLGIKRTVEKFGPMLQHPKKNPHATLITLFMNATHEINAQRSDHEARALMTLQTRRIAKYMTFGPMDLHSPCGPPVIKMMMAQELVKNVDQDFEQYMKWTNFKEVEQSGRLEVKKENTIIEKWPMKLKLKPGQKGAKEEFDLLLSSSHTGQERYVEWKVKQ